MLTTKRIAELLDFFGKRYDSETAKLLGHIPSTPHWMVTAGDMLLNQAVKITELQSELETMRKDAERYLALRRMAVELSLSHQVISQFVTNQAELDAAIKEQA